ncbi:ATP-dependent Clp protease ATP-binding subunit [Dehalococcoidia bacterium]|nr:ATP-dependent Clp protease ATP-binding subunit [Dehalococcoidia bacterium]
MPSREEEEAERRESFWKTFVGRDLTDLATEERIGPIYQREDLINGLVSLLSTEENNPLLIGEPGAGKNAIVEGLACWIAEEKVNLDKTIMECTIDSFHSGCLYAHEFETKIQTVIKKLRENEIILFLDRIDMAIWAGGTAGVSERTLATLLDPYLARNELTIIGATTPDGYDFMLKNNPLFTNRFIKVEVPPTSPGETREILSSVKRKFADRYKVRIQEESLDAIIDMSDRFYRERFFPGKAFEILREIIASKKLDSFQDSGGSYKRKKGKSRSTSYSEITPNDVYETFQRRTGLPRFIIFREERKKQEDIRKYFTDRIFGQEEAIENIVDTILSLKAELNDPQKPAGVFLFVGPTGVGKTWLARSLATYLFGSEKKLLRYDMPEYATYDSLTKLIGGKERERGKLIEDVLANPFSVILLDEIEKAHGNIFDLLLPLMGEGRLTDDSGRTVSFCNTIVIMTSNIGAELYGKERFGLKTDTRQDPDVVEKDLLKKVKEWFRPEFINRLTRVVQFKPLSRETIKDIAQKEIENLAQRKGITYRNLKIDISDQVIDLLLGIGYSQEYGARPMQRAVERYIGYPLAAAISAGDIKGGDQLRIDLDQSKKIKIETEEEAKGETEGEGKITYFFRRIRGKT